MPYVNDRNLKIAAGVVTVAKEIGKKPSQVALRWLLQRSVPCFPIIGGKKLEQIVDNVHCTEFVLDKKQMDRLDKVSHIELGFPHDFLKSELVRNMAMGGWLAKSKTPMTPHATDAAVCVILSLPKEQRWEDGSRRLRIRMIR